MANKKTTDFLAEIEESCDDIWDCWESARELDFGEIGRIKARVESYLLTEKPNILRFYDYGQNKGAYSLIYCRDLLQLLCEYEAYHDDLVGFIKTMVGNETSVHGQKNAMDYVAKACHADEEFREKLFGMEAADRILFKDALSNLDAAMAFHTFLDKVSDTLIEFSNQDVTIPRVKGLLGMYQFSVLSFIREFTTEITTTIQEMTNVMNGAVVKKKESKEYVLF